MYVCMYVFILRERGREGERQRNIVWLPLVYPTQDLGTWPATQACALTGNRTSNNALVYRPALNSLSYTSQGS